MEIRDGKGGYRGPAREGDFTLCMDCGAIQKFAADLSLFTPRLDEMSESAVHAQMIVLCGDLKKSGRKSSSNKLKTRISPQGKSERAGKPE